MNDIDVSSRLIVDVAQASADNVASLEMHKHVATFSVCEYTRLTAEIHI